MYVVRDMWTESVYCERRTLFTTGIDLLGGLYSILGSQPETAGLLFRTSFLHSLRCGGSIHIPFVVSSTQTKT